MTVAVLHSYTHVLGWAYFRIGWAYFRVKGGPIFGRGVLENTPIPLFEQILNSSPMGVFSRDYGTVNFKSASFTLHIHVHAVVSEVTRPLFSAPSGECAGMCVCVYVQCVFVFAF